MVAYPTMLRQHTPPHFKTMIMGERGKDMFKGIKCLAPPKTEQNTSLFLFLKTLQSFCLLTNVALKATSWI